MRPWRPLLPWLLVIALPAIRAASAGGGGGSAGEPPQENSSYVPDDDENVRKAMAAADKAVEAKDWLTVARSLQKVVDGAGEAVLPVSEGKVLEGAWIVAHHRIARLGAPALAAYELEFGGAARAALEAAVETRSEEALARLVTRWLPTASGRRATLLLADLAIERGDSDAALGWLERLEDLESVAAEDLQPMVAATREDRLTRESVAQASKADAVPRIKAWLADPKSPRPAADDFRRAAPAVDWKTSGGDASRGLVPPTLKGSLEFVADHELHYETSSSEEGARSESDAADPERGRPSPWLPPRAVVEGDRVFVSDGRFLEAYSFETGKLLAGLDQWPLMEGATMRDVVGISGEEARTHWGLIEGHGLTVEGDTAWCAVPSDRALSLTDDPSEEEPPPGLEEEAPPPPKVEAGPEAKAARLDHVAAIRVAGPDAGKVIWRAGGLDEEKGLPKKIRLYGAPLLYRGTLYIGGVRPTEATPDRWETYLIALDPETGAARGATFLGAGGPIRHRNDSEVMPSSCAAARGRVVIVTALGFAAAVDAASGRTAWTFRYDRGRPDGDDVARRLLPNEERNPRRTTFSNEPPILSGGRCYFTPTDSKWLYATVDRPKESTRWLRAWQLHRTADFVNMALEHLAGVTGGSDGVPATLVGVGQGYYGTGEVSTCVVGMDVENHGAVRWGRGLPDGGRGEPYGRALVTETQVYVSTREGIWSYKVSDGAELPQISAETLPASVATLLRGDGRRDERLWGNLIAVPGRGIVALNEDYVAFWRVR